MSKEKFEEIIESMKGIKYHEWFSIKKFIDDEFENKKWTSTFDLPKERIGVELRKYETE